VHNTNNSSLIPKEHNTLSVSHIINSMEHNPFWEADSHSDGQEIPHPLWNLKVHYCVHNSLPLKPNWIRWIWATPTYFLIVFSHLHLGLQRCCTTSCFQTKILYVFLIFPLHTTCPADLILFDLVSVSHVINLQLASIADLTFLESIQVRLQNSSVGFLTII